MSIDHRAEAELHLAAANTADGDDEETTQLRYALVHATLAAGTPIADQHVLDELQAARTDRAGAEQDRDEAERKLTRLREAARDLLTAATDVVKHADPHSWSDGKWFAVDSGLLLALAGQVREATEALNLDTEETTR